MSQKEEIKIVALSTLKAHEQNPNVHPADQIDALAKSIDKYGQYYPIIVDENMTVLCGHGKWLALQKLGREEGEVRIIRGLSEKQKMKLVLEDNKIQGMSYCDFSKVEEIIKSIGDTDIIGFGTDYLETIINENVKDNMGVDFNVPVERKSNEKQVADIPEETKQEQDEEADNFESGMQKARTMICPHCGKEITL